MGGKKIKIASAVILNENKDLLVVRKRKSSFYMLPGGKIELNETLIDALLRELQEELNLALDADNFNFLGIYETNAANEINTRVEGNIFLLNTSLTDLPSSFAEIEEVCWISKSSYKDYQLAHLLKEFVLPKWLNDFK